MHRLHDKSRTIRISLQRSPRVLKADRASHLQGCVSLATETPRVNRAQESYNALANGFEAEGMRLDYPSG
jgi:hypothetical protein